METDKLLEEARGHSKQARNKLLEVLSKDTDSYNDEYIEELHRVSLRLHRIIKQI